MKYGWQKYFPFEIPRKIQIEAIEFILNSFFKLNKKFVICELPVGSGKSAIAITIAKYFQENYKSDKLATWLLTTQKILQKQYTNEFSFLSNIWSKQNYRCKKHYNISCQYGLWINSIFNGKYCDCVYLKDKEKFLSSEISLTNIQYFLNTIEYESLLKRKILIIDEAHNIENAIINFVSLKLTKFQLEKYNILWKTTEDVIDWIKTDILPSLSDFKEHLNNLIKSQNKNNFLNSYNNQEIIKEYDEIDSFIKDIERCIKYFNEKTWIINNSEDFIEIKPIFSKDFTDKYLFSTADKILLMSGTILDKKMFCEINGIPIEDTEFISLDSPFDKKNRPIYFLDAGFLNYKNIDSNLKNISLIVSDIINEYKDKKGIIHCHSYKIANYIYNNIKTDRFLINNSNNILEIYDLHLNNEKPTILLSPSFKEGIDLIDDLSRFQIIIKMPYPDLGNPYIKEKMNRIPYWYNWETAKNLIQSIGRSVRHENDYSETYILDSNFKNFLEKNKKIFPKWFIESIIYI